MSEWEEEAHSWIRWARTPGHDVYWHVAPLFFSQILPPPSGETLEVGCGEGRVARALAEHGHAVIGVDSAPTLLAAAREVDPGGTYVLADSAHLPFDDGRFGVVVAYNVLMDVEDLDGTVAEAARVLQPGGFLCICVIHPLNDAAVISGDAFVLQRPYLTSEAVDETVEGGGLRMRFRGWRHPLERYAVALEAAGLVIDRLREPGMPPAAVAERPALARWTQVPMFLFLRARKLGG
jgi:SAM-dependent methyltransferase